MPTKQEETGYSSRTEKYEKKHKKRRIRKKAVVIIVCVIALLVGACAGLATMTVKPPSIAEVIPGIQQTDEDSAEEREPGVYNVLVVGTDKVGYNTDTILVMSLDSVNNRANILSIPRDTMSNVNRAVKKINAAYSIGAKKGKGNIDGLKEEVSYLLGFEVDNYVVVNLGAFEEIVDTIGGVTVDVPRDMDYDDPYQDLHIHIKKGLQTLDGQNAIGFVRYRKGYAEGDLGRVKAQQMFLKALAKKVATPAIVTKVPKLADIILDNMDTDLSNGEILWFAKEAAGIDMENDLQMFVLPGEAQYVGAISYYLPDEAGILEVVNNYFNPYATPIHTLNVVNVGNIAQKQPDKTPVANEQSHQEEGNLNNRDNQLQNESNGPGTESEGQSAGVQQNGNHGQSGTASQGKPSVETPSQEPTVQETPAEPQTPAAPEQPSGGQSGYNTIPGEVLKSDAE